MKVLFYLTFALFLFAGDTMAATDVTGVYRANNGASFTLTKLKQVYEVNCKYVGAKAPGIEYYVLKPMDGIFGDLQCRTVKKINDEKGVFLLQLKNFDKTKCLPDRNDLVATGEENYAYKDVFNLRSSNPSYEFEPQITIKNGSAIVWLPSQSRDEYGWSESCHKMDDLEFIKQK